jgi:DNA-binding winged helix-turn-helix (wHTH) protein
MIGARAFAFGSFLLVPERQLLMQGDSAVRIGGRALDLLTALVERPGEIVSKRELMARAWPTTTVEDCNLKVHIAGLRRTLGDAVGDSRYIATVNGRGYRFVAPVEARAALGLRSAKANNPGAPAHHALTSGLFEIVGYGIVTDGDIMLRLDDTVLLLKPGGMAARPVLRPAVATFPTGPSRMLIIQLDGD